MHILIAINETAHMEDVIKFSLPFIKRTAAVPTFLEIVNPGNHRGLGQISSLDIAVKAQELQTRIHEITGIRDFDIRVRVGKPEEEIPHEVQEGEYDLVIFNDLGFKKLPMGLKKPVVYRIAERVPCSVLIMRGEARPVRKILLCDSGAREARLVNRFLSQVSGVLDKGEMIAVLHVMSQISAGPGVRGKQLRADADELIVNHTPEGDLLERDVVTLQKSGLQATPIIRHGLVVEEILAEVQAGDYDLVVIGTNRERWQHFLLDDLAQQIVKVVDKPLLVIK